MKFRRCEPCLRKCRAKYEGLSAQIDNGQTEISNLGAGKEIQEITKFVDDAAPQSFEKPGLAKVTQWIKMAEDSHLHSIHNILQRPVKILDGIFMDPLPAFDIKFPDALLVASTNMVRKLDYFTYFRANVKVKIVFNATPFQSGKYWLYFSPYDTICNRGARNYAANQTGYPGTELDIASGAPIELKVPYCAPLSHYNLVDGHSNMGHLFMVPLVPIAEGAMPSTGAPFSVFAWFEDIQLALPTSVTVQPPLLAQVYSEAGEKVDHPISGTLSRIGGIAGFVGDSVPKLAAFCRPVEWVARVLSFGAASFGWNKPTHLEAPCALANVPGKNYTHADGVDASVCLSAMPDCGLTVPTGLFSTDVDEMDIRYVCKKSCVFSQSDIVWTPAAPAGLNLFTFYVAPGLTQFTTGAAPHTELGPTTCGFVSSMFRYWRGAMKYRIAAAKTAFHSGRLRITFHPSVYDPSTAGLVYENAYNWILDLSVSSEIEFEVPYVSNVPWKQTLIDEAGHLENWGKEKFSTGMITITVLTPLKVANGAATSNVGINLWSSGTDDTAFAIPNFQANYVTSMGFTPPTLEEPLEAQILNETNKGIEHNEQTINTADKMFDMPSMDFTSAEQLCIGEKITSLRQLIKRFGISARMNPYPYLDAAGPPNYTYVGALPLPLAEASGITVDPAYFGHLTAGHDVNSIVATLPSSRDTAGIVATTSQHVGNYTSRTLPLQYISYLYRFYCGSKRYKYFSGQNAYANPNVQSIGPLWVDSATPIVATSMIYGNTQERRRSNMPLIAYRASTIIENGAIAPVAILNTIGQTGVGFSHTVYSDLNPIVEIEAPYYSQTPISLVAEGTVVSTEGPTISRSHVRFQKGDSLEDINTPVVMFTKDSPYPISYESTREYFGSGTLYEAAGDDFTFGYLVGAPSVKRRINLP